MEPESEPGDKDIGIGNHESEVQIFLKIKIKNSIKKHVFQNNLFVN